MKQIVAFLLIAIAFGGCKGSESSDSSGQTPGTTPGTQDQQAQSVTLKISCGAVGPELKTCTDGVAAWSKKTGHKVEVVSTPNETDARLALYQQLLGAGADDIDVFQIDVIWPGILKNHFIDLKPYTNGAEKNYFAALIENNTVNGRLVAMPWFIASGLLFYRQDLLEKYGEKPPTTWDELAATAKKIQDAERAAGNDGMWGYVWQGRAYEGLTCDALEWIVSHNGGTIVDNNGKVTINNPQAIKAIEMAAGWIGTITPEGVLNYAEEDARGLFQTGKAVFMRNWPYAWGTAQSDDSPIKGKVGVSPLPKGGADGRHAAALGGWQLAVSKYSKHQAAAADLVMHLTSSEELKRRALTGSYNPTMPELYKDPDILKANPFMGELYDTLVNSVPRPSTIAASKYNQMSNEFWNGVHAVLSKKSSAADSLKAVEDKLNTMSRGGTRW